MRSRGTTTSQSGCTLSRQLFLPTTIGMVGADQAHPGCEPVANSGGWNGEKSCECCGQGLHGSGADQGYSADQCRTDSGARSDDGFDFGVADHSVDDQLSKQQGIPEGQGSDGEEEDL